jgi:ribosomal protein L6P/L9E
MSPKTKAAKPAAKLKKPKVVITKALQKSVAAKITKTDMDIKAANLAKMKAITAKNNKKVATKKRKLDKLVDDVEKSFGSTGDIRGNAVDPGWDSMDGIEVKNFLGGKEVKKIDLLPGVTVKLNPDLKDELIFEGIDNQNVSLSCAQTGQVCKIGGKDDRKFLDGIYVSERTTLA